MTQLVGLEHGSSDCQSNPFPLHQVHHSECMLNAVPRLARVLVRSTFHHLVLAINGRGLDDAKMRSIFATIDLCYAINS